VGGRIRFWAVTPLLSVALAYAAGVLAGLRWAPQLAWAAVAVAGLALVFLNGHPPVASSPGSSRTGSSRTGSRQSGPEANSLVSGGAASGTVHAPWRRWLPLLLFGAAGVFVGGVRGEAARTDCRTRLPDGLPIRVVGVPAALPTEGSALVFRAREFSAGQGTCTVALVRVRPHAKHLAVLDSAARGLSPAVAVHGRWLAYPRRGGWPAPPQYAGSVLVDSVVAVPGAGRSSAVLRFRVAQQARLRSLLPARWPLAEALLLAQKSGLTPETRSRWVAAGLVHLLAISGMHVGLIAAGVLALAGAAGLSRRRSRRLAVLLTGAYVLFLGAPTAALRALLQATLLLTSVELQRPAEPFTLLAAAGLTILLLEPLALLEPGFQLSFAGMVGLIGWRQPVSDALPRRLPAWVRAGLAAGVAASALTTPIAALHFGQAAWIGIVGSLVAVPLLAASVAALLLALVVAALTGSTAGPHALLADVVLRLLEQVADLCARLPGGHAFVSAPTVLALLAAAATAIVVRGLLQQRAHAAESLPPSVAAPEEAYLRYAGRARAARVRWLIGAAAAVAVLAAAPAVRPHHGNLHIHAIDVGQGDAFAIRTPRGRWILVDAGPRTAHADAGRDRVVPFLLRHGARRIEALILTHSDADHIGGAAAVLEAFDVPLVVDPGLPAGKDMFIDLLATARTGGQRWVAGNDDIVFTVDGVQFTLLYPRAALDASGTANDNSLVFRLEFGTFSALFLGDAPEAVEDELVARHGEQLRAAVLKVGHHGSSTSTGEALLMAARPTIALVSAGRRNRYGHPSPVVLHRLARHQVRVLRTDQLGTISVQVTRSGEVRVLAR
jgi:competence protein ComEC